MLHFMLSGGDSLQALRVCDEITVAMGITSVGLLEVILDGSFSDVVSHVMTETHNAIQPSKKRMLDDSGSIVTPKRQQKEMSTVNATQSTVGFVVSSVRRTVGFVVVRRAGEVIDWGCFQKMQEKNFSDALGTNESKLTVTNTSEDSLISNPSHELHNISQENPAIKRYYLSVRAQVKVQGRPFRCSGRWACGSSGVQTRAGVWTPLQCCWWVLKGPLCSLALTHTDCRLLTCPVERVIWSVSSEIDWSLQLPFPNAEAL